MNVAVSHAHEQLILMVDENQSVNDRKKVINCQFLKNLKDTG
ncbi:hypothetical protein [Paenimyroides baculatum]|nr:hypothetical protein [Paenimyroides baculatum]